MSSKAAEITNRGFLETAFEHMCKGEYAAITSFSGDPLTVERHAWAARPWQHGMPVPGSIMGRPQNVYMAVSSFKPAVHGTFHRRKDDFAQLHVVMVDDVYEKVDRRKLKLAPSAMIQTSPASAQAFYFLKPSPETRDRATCEGLIDAMVRSGLTASGADPGMRGVTRYGRLPMAVNSKGKYVAKLGHPFRCELRLWHPERRYSMLEIAKAFRLDLNTAKAHVRQGNPNIPIMRQSKPVKLRRGEALRRVNDFEEMLKTLSNAGLYVSSRGPWHEIACPWTSEHTDQKPGGSALYSPAESNAWLGGYKCWHGHCEGRTVGDVYRFSHSLARGAA
jgi:DNA primase RepB-like protein